MKKRMGRAIVAATVVAALAAAPAAFAQSTGTGYAGQSGVAGQVAGGGGSGGNNGAGGNNGVAGTTANRSAAAQVSEGTNGVLAFTGLDLALLAGGGLVLLLSGFALSRLVVRRTA